MPMMRDMDEFGYASGDGWQAVELPYVGGKLAMLVIVPTTSRRSRPRSTSRRWLR